MEEEGLAAASSPKVKIVDSGIEPCLEERGEVKEEGGEDDEEAYPGGEGGPESLRFE